MDGTHMGGADRTKMESPGSPAPTAGAPLLKTAGLERSSSGGPCAAGAAGREAGLSRNPGCRELEKIKMTREGLAAHFPETHPQKSSPSADPDPDIHLGTPQTAAQ